MAKTVKFLAIHAFIWVNSTLKPVSKKKHPRIVPESFNSTWMGADFLCCLNAQKKSSHRRKTGMARNPLVNVIIGQISAIAGSTFRRPHAGWRH